MVLNVKYSKNKGNNRHSLDIVRDMLFAASVRARKTRIMYQANLSFVQVEKYLNGLLEKGLVDHDDTACYLITKKGLEFLRLYDEYIERCRLVEEQVGRTVRDRLILEQMCSGRIPNRPRTPTRKLPLP